VSITDRSRRTLVAAGLITLGLAVFATPAGAQTIDGPVVQETPAVEVPEVAEVPDVPAVSVTIDGAEGGLSSTVTLILLLTLGSILPGLLLLATSFTRFIVVLGLTRNAIGIQSAPPTPVLIGIALFLTLFVMKPVLTEVYDEALQPLMDQQIELTEAYDKAYDPLREFMLTQTRDEDLRLFLDLSNEVQPESPEEIGASVLVPAYVVSELRTAFVIGFVVFVPFLVIDLIVSTVLMALGMVMLPPTFISLPLKLLLFVLVDGWVLLIGSLVSSVNG
jgi:flagellar biosynthetic protein FliP